MILTVAGLSRPFGRFFTGVVDRNGAESASRGRRYPRVARGYLTAVTSRPGTRPPPIREDELEEAFERLVDEGEVRLRRPILALLSTGVLGGIDVGTGVLAYLLVKQATHSPLLAGLAFSIGFVALLLARTELFTENFLVPVITVIAKKGSIAALARLWAVTL